MRGRQCCPELKRPDEQRGLDILLVQRLAESGGDGSDDEIRAAEARPLGTGVETDTDRQSQHATGVPTGDEAVAKVLDELRGLTFSDC